MGYFILYEQKKGDKKGARRGKKPCPPPTFLSLDKKPFDRLHSRIDHKPYFLLVVLHPKDVSFGGGEPRAKAKIRCA